jgi:S1-C subfamily serine protease
VNKFQNADAGRVIGGLEQLTGPSEGSVSELTSTTLDVILEMDGSIEICPAGLHEHEGNDIARFHLSGDTFEIEARGSGPLWVNREKVKHRRLNDGDLIEFGETGPISQFRIRQLTERPPKVIGQIVENSIAYVKSSRKPTPVKAWRVFARIGKATASQTTFMFRIGVLAAIAAVGYILYQQQEMNVLLQQKLERDKQSIEGFAEALSKAQEHALTEQDLTELREQFGQRVIGHEERLAALERSRTAGARAITAVRSSVLFLQGAYAFRHTESGKLLRFAVTPAGGVLVGPRGTPRLTLEGEGPVAERMYTGTGFILARLQLIATNRHVAIPWEEDANLSLLKEQGLEPEFTKFIAYLPDQEKPYPVKLLAVGEIADIALLEFAGPLPETDGLELSATGVVPGDGVIVLGYPTGLRAMVAQAGKQFIEKVQSAGETDFWKLAQMLASDGFIEPLASQGIVAKVTDASIVYDAETTRGGSGGPVIDLEGRVVGVNSAILPEYGGSNSGVPVSRLEALLARLSDDKEKPSD